MTTNNSLDNSNNCIEVTSLNFEEVVAGSNLPVIIDFWAPWCAPCRMMKPVFYEISNEMKDQFNFVTINIDENSELAAKFRVMKIPYFILLNKNQIEKTTSGAMSKSDLINWVLN